MQWSYIATDWSGKPLITWMYLMRLVDGNAVCFPTRTHRAAPAPAAAAGAAIMPALRCVARLLNIRWLHVGGLSACCDWDWQAWPDVRWVDTRTETQLHRGHSQGRREYETSLPIESWAAFAAAVATQRQHQRRVQFVGEDNGKHRWHWTTDVTNQRWEFQSSNQRRREILRHVQVGRRWASHYR